MPAVGAGRIRFLLDEHIPFALAEGLRRRGIDVLTPGEAGLLGAADAAYMDRSNREGRVLVTHDGDFLGLHREQEHAGIAYCEQGARTVGQMVSGLVLIYEVLDANEMAGRVEFL